MDQQILNAHELGRRFGRRWVLAHVELRLAAGGSLLVVGPNGSGKTTLLCLIAGCLEATTGSVRVFGFDPRRHRTTVRTGLSLVSHHLSLYPRLTGSETLALWLRLGGGRALPPASEVASGPRARRRAGGEIESSRVEELLAAAGLGDYGDVEVGAYSAGMCKRLALARVRIERPRLLLLDEPFSALDAAGRAWLAGWLAELRDEGVTLVLASHSLDQAAPLCDDAVRLEDGQVVWRGPAAALVTAAPEGPASHELRRRLAGREPLHPKTSPADVPAEERDKR